MGAQKTSSILVVVVVVVVNVCALISIFVKAYVERQQRNSSFPYRASRIIGNMAMLELSFIQFSFSNMHERLSMTLSIKTHLYLECFIECTQAQAQVRALVATQSDII